MKFYITKHCKQRYIERVLGNLNSKEDVLKSIFKDLNNSKNITSKLSTEVPRFILFLKDKYGSCNIMKHDHILFICKKRKGAESLYDVVTCYIDKDDLSMFRNSVLTNEEIHLKLKLLKYNDSWN